MAIGAQQDESRVADWIHAFSVGGLNQLGKLNPALQTQLANTLSMAFRLSSHERFFPQLPGFSRAEDFAEGLTREHSVRPFGEDLWTRQSFGTYDYGQGESQGSYDLPEAIASELLRLRKPGMKDNFGPSPERRTRGRSVEDGLEQWTQSKATKPLPPYRQLEQTLLSKILARRVR